MELRSWAYAATRAAQTSGKGRHNLPSEDDGPGALILTGGQACRIAKKYRHRGGGRERVRR